MQSIMLGLTSVPGVMGGMLSDEDGNILAHSLPPYFDIGTIKGAADLFQDNTVGLQEITGGVRLFDIRCDLGRLIIKTLPNSFLAILCQPSVNIQLLLISLNVTIKKLERFSAEQTLNKTAPQAGAQITRLAVPSRSAGAYQDYRATTDAKGVLLACKIMQKTGGTFWESMTDNASVNRDTALEVSNFFKTGSFKKLTVTNTSNGISKHVPIAVIQHDRDHIYDGKIILTQSLTELLHAKEGDQIRVAVVIGGGILGWDGI